LGDNLEKAKRELFHKLRREIRDDRVLQVMEKVPREIFIPPSHRHLAYEDIPVPIGEGQTISQPYIVAMMTSALELKETDQVLELGTGSGYQTAILACLVPRGRVVSVERVPSLASRARSLLTSLGLVNVRVLEAGNVLGYPELAPYNAIVVTAAAPRLPPSLLSQLAPGGRMVIPVGTLQEQELMKVVKTSDGYNVHALGPCRFVPLIGPEAWPEEERG